MKTISLRSRACLLAVALLAASGLAWVVSGGRVPILLSTFQQERWQQIHGGTPAAGGSMMVRLDPRGGGHLISPLIYGVSAADPETVRALGATVDRWGGTPPTRYNWANGNAWKADRAWEFRNVNSTGNTGSAADS